MNKRTSNLYYAILSTKEFKTTTISFRVRVEWADDIKKLVKDEIEKRKWQDTSSID